jgi:prepilin-type N-terminal cleavage/methylation domain-containing protein
MTKNNSGLSLIEVMVSVVILSVIGVVMSTIITRTFSGNSKTELIGNIKYQGQSVLSVMEKNIRESDTVVCPASGTSNSITLLTRTEGKYIRYTFSPESVNVNGTIYSEVLVFTNSPTVVHQLCDLLYYPLNFQNTRQALIDSTSNTAVSLKPISGLGFTVVKSPGYKDTVKIQFDLGPPINSGDKIEDSLGGNNAINFQTTLQIR